MRAAIGVALLAGPAVAPPGAVAGPGPDRAAVPAADSTEVGALPSRAAPKAAAPAPDRLTATALPVEGSARLVGANVAGTAVGGLTVTRRAAAGVGAVRIATAPTAKGPGVLLSVVRDDGGTKPGRVGLDLDYSGFRNAYGADFGSRLRLVRLPGCALATPAVAACQAGTPVAAQRNDTARAVVSADALEAGGSGRAAVYALAAEGSSDAGDFGATSMAPSYSWSAGNQGGDFTYSYPFRLPPVPSGLVPEVALSYASGSVDGRTSSTNNQPSWVGEGWDYHPGYIERSHRSCRQDGQTTDDLCLFDQDHLTMVFGGRATRIVKDDNGAGFKAENDTGLRIDRMGGAANGANSGRYWQVWTPDGTRYIFGSTTESAQTVVVYGDDPGEECYHTSLAEAGCQQAYRWNLRQVIDARGNRIDYHWAETRQKYAAYGGLRTHPYDLYAVLDHIDYGLTDGVSGGPVARVVFSRGKRCLEEPCTGSAEAHAKWYDTPWDLNCAIDWDSCPNRPHYPTFFSFERLTAVTTQVLRPGTTATYDDVDRWELGHRFAGTGDGTSMSLQLAGISHVGLVGGTVARPEVQFGITKHANRVNNSAQVPFYKYRLTSILSGTGGRTDVTYTNSPWSGTVCTPGTLPANPDTNDKHCFPVWFNGAFHYFHKYVVSAVTETDLTGASNVEHWGYEYSTEGSSTAQLWKHDMNQLVPDAQQSWSQWAGYSTVTVRHGSLAYGSATKSRYYRGLNGTKTQYGSRAATINDSVNTGLVDAAGFAGLLREQATAESGTFHTYARTTVATKTRSWAYGTWNAYRADETETATRAKLADGSWRWASSRTTYDGLGLPTLVEDRGDEAVTTDGTCTYTGYARNVDPTHSLLDLPAQVLTTRLNGAAGCPATAVGADALSGSQTFYDGSDTLGAAPSEGLATSTRALTGPVGGALTWVRSSSAEYDAYGRVTSVGDALGRTNGTEYTPAAGGAVTSVRVTNPKGHTSVTALRHEWGLPASTTDTNNNVTSLTYDPAGRLRTVDLPGGPATPETEYTYTLRPTGPNVVATRTLNWAGTPVTAYQLFDGRMRPAQTQTPGDDDHPGRIVATTHYDDRGLVWKTSQFYNDAPPSDTYVTAADADIPSQHRYYHDRLGRQTGDEQWAGITVRWRTSTDYPGADQTVVTPPAGGTKTTSFTDARGNQVRLRQHLTASTQQDTNYRHDQLNRLVHMTDAAGNVWGYTYDRRGGQVESTDPDRGKVTSRYDVAGQLSSTTDANGTTVAHRHDELGRTTGTFLDSTSGTQLAGWTYDTLKKGRLTSATRYDGTNAYTTAVTGYDHRNRPLGTSVTLPASAGAGLAGTWTTTTAYNLDGSVASVTLPAAGGLPAEILTSRYDTTGHLLTMGSPLDTYISDVSYHWWGEVYQTLQGAASGGGRVRVTQDREPDTRRLRLNSVATESRTTPGTWDEQLAETYAYDPAGNVTGIREAKGSTTVASQCFGYDGLSRLTEAWTTGASACQAAPAQGTVGGADAYWHSWTYDAADNRRTETRHAAAGDTVATYTYPAAGAARPHALTQVATSGAATTDRFEYDAAGNTTVRAVRGTTQGMTWTPDGHLATHTIDGRTTRYDYDADGNRLLRRDPGGRVTAYLGGFEVSRSETGAVTATRYYGDVASRNTATGLTRLAADRHGTQLVAAQDASVTIRRTTPFGTPRGAAAAWPNAKGFVGGIQDPTGLTHLGAREYDPALGRFLSVDPLLDLTDPQQWNAYAYAGNNPTTRSDPSGLRACAQGEDCADASHPPSQSRPPQSQPPPQTPQPPSKTTTQQKKQRDKVTQPQCLLDDCSPDNIVDKAFDTFGFQFSFADISYMVYALHYAKETNTDPRIILAVTLMEAHDLGSWKVVQRAQLAMLYVQLGARGVLDRPGRAAVDLLSDKDGPSLGVTNMKLQALADVEGQYPEKFRDVEISDLIDDDGLAIKAFAYRMDLFLNSGKKNESGVPDQFVAAIAHQTRHGYNAFKDWSTLNAADNQHITGHYERLRESYQKASYMICQSGAFQC